MRSYKGLNRIALLLLILAAHGSLAGCQAGYLARQGIRQLQLFSQRRPVEEVLGDPAVDPAVKSRIRWVKRARAFGERAFGLRAARSFRSYVEIQEDFVAYAVSASRRDRLEPYLWRFPLVGELPYKGFFKLEEARKEKRLMEQRGYDAQLGGVMAFSSLGWFPEPIYSSLLKSDRIDLTYTLFHEMLHATVFFPGKPEFNEQLATFVGWQAARSFVAHELGEDSPEARNVQKAIEDEKRFSRFLEWARSRLEALYGLPISIDEKLSRREGVFQEIRDRFCRLYPRFETSRFSSQKSMHWNNASFLSLWRYRYNTGALDRFYGCLGFDLKKLIQTVRRWQKTGLEPKEQIERRLDDGCTGRQDSAIRRPGCAVPWPQTIPGGL